MSNEDDQAIMFARSWIAANIFPGPHSISHRPICRRPVSFSPVRCKSDRGSHRSDTRRCERSRRSWPESAESGRSVRRAASP